MPWRRQRASRKRRSKPATFQPMIEGPGRAPRSRRERAWIHRGFVRETVHRGLAVSATRRGEGGSVGSAPASTRNTASARPPGPARRSLPAASAAPRAPSGPPPPAPPPAPALDPALASFPLTAMDQSRSRRSSPSSPEVSMSSETARRAGRQSPARTRGSTNSRNRSRRSARPWRIMGPVTNRSMRNRSAAPGRRIRTARDSNARGMPRARAATGNRGRRRARRRGLRASPAAGALPAATPAPAGGSRPPPAREAPPAPGPPRRSPTARARAAGGVAPVPGEEKDFCRRIHGPPAPRPRLGPPRPPARERRGADEPCGPRAGGAGEGLPRAPDYALIPAAQPGFLRGLPESAGFPGSAGFPPAAGPGPPVVQRARGSRSQPCATCLAGPRRRLDHPLQNYNPESGGRWTPGGCPVDARWMPDGCKGRHRRCRHGPGRGERS